MNKCLLEWPFCTAVLAAVLGLYAAPASAGPKVIGVEGKESVTFVVDGLSGATGYGAHFSTYQSSNGYGGTYAECHMRVNGVSPSTTLSLLCFDGFQSQARHVNRFDLAMGNQHHDGRPRISHATITVTRRGVHVDAVVVATNPYNSERKPYTTSAFFPLRESTGFFATGSIYLDGDCNGVLSNTPGREGTGFVCQTPVVR